MAEERPPTEQALDLFVYAPIGLLLGGPRPLPAAVARGRECIESQVNFARLVGKFAVRQGTHHVRLRVARLFDGDGAPAPSATEAAVESAPVRVAADKDEIEVTIAVRHESAELAIPEYDSLAASQVVPRLAGLSTSELEAVRVYESDHRGRRTILARIDQLRGPGE